MDAAAYYVSLLLVVVLPPALLCWLVIHPCARYWRRVGPLVTYTVVVLFAVLVGAGIYQFREPLLRARFEPTALVTMIGAVLLVLVFYFDVQRWRRLPNTVLLGLPEISTRRRGGKLVTEGIYAKVRHPRYVSGVFIILSMAMLTNYVTMYLLLVLYIPLIYLIVILEERELRNRFGDAYVRYCERVPRFMPRLR